ncbi:hypothetical protein HHI36_014454, partial [Cryptolaemus montrouzieri]
NTDRGKNHETAFHYDSCRGGIHRCCSGLNEDEIKITRTQVRNLKILYNECTTIMDTFGLILESINALREELNININTQISALREGFNAKIDAISTRNDQIAELPRKCCNGSFRASELR